MLRQIFGFVTIGCLCASAGSAGSGGLDSYIRHEMEAQKIPGVAFVVIDHGKIVEEHMDWRISKRIRLFERMAYLRSLRSPSPSPQLRLCCSCKMAKSDSTIR
jgi:hypothetical protein